MDTQQTGQFAVLGTLVRAVTFTEHPLSDADYKLTTFATFSCAEARARTRLEAGRLDPG
jgi:hypothetical protein